MKFKPLLLLLLFVHQSFGFPAQLYSGCCNDKESSEVLYSKKCCKNDGVSDKSDTKKEDGTEKGCCTDKCPCHHALKTFSLTFESKSISAPNSISFKTILPFTYKSLKGKDLINLIFQPPKF